MLTSIKEFFESRLSPAENEEADTGLSTDLASAALMIEVMRSDHRLDAREEKEFLHVLQVSLGISEQDLKQLVELARSKASQATSLYEFTRLINDRYSYVQKVALIKNMWRIAFSDEELDKYEEHLIRKISELVYVSHSDFIRTKLEVKRPSE